MRIYQVWKSYPLSNGDNNLLISLIFIADSKKVEAWEYNWNAWFLWKPTRVLCCYRICTSNLFLSPLCAAVNYGFMQCTCPDWCIFLEMFLYHTVNFCIVICPNAQWGCCYISRHLDYFCSLYYQYSFLYLTFKITNIPKKFFKKHVQMVETLLMCLDM